MPRPGPQGPFSPPSAAAAAGQSGRPPTRRGRQVGRPPKGPLGLLETPGVARATQSCEGAQEALPMTAARAGHAPRAASASAGWTRPRLRPARGVRSAPGAASYAWPQPGSPLGPRRPRDAPRPTTPGHSPRGRPAAGPAAAAAAAAGPAWRALCPGCGPGRRLRGRCGQGTGRGRRDDSAAVAGLRLTRS